MPYQDHTMGYMHYDGKIKSLYDTKNETPRYEIRLSIFFISALCVGVTCLIWAFILVHRQRKTRGRISAFIILLLLSDLLQLLLYPYIVSKVLSSSVFHVFHSVFEVLGYFFLKVCGLHLQQLVALEGVLTLKYPLISAHIFSKPCYIIISITILIFPSMCALLMALGGFVGVVGLYLCAGSVLAPVCLLVVTGIITYKAPPTPARAPATDTRAGVMLFLVSMLTLVMLYFPCLLVSCIHLYNMSWYVMSHCLLSLTVISEPLLCVLVCRENLSAETKQTHIELNSEQTSV